ASVNPLASLEPSLPLPCLYRFTASSSPCFTCFLITLAHITITLRSIGTDLAEYFLALQWSTLDKTRESVGSVALKPIALTLVWNRAELALLSSKGLFFSVESTFVARAPAVAPSAKVGYILCSFCSFLLSILFFVVVSKFQKSEKNGENFIFNSFAGNEENVFDYWFSYAYIRHTCRRCRFEKCLAVGMNKDSVPTAPNYITKDADWNKPKSSVESESASEASSWNSRFLDKVMDQYRILEQSAVKSDEDVMTAALGDKLQRRNDHLPATIVLFNQCARASHQAMIDFTTNCFPDINELDDTDKWLVIKNFITARFIFDGVHRAQKIFPGNDRIFMVTFHTFVDIDNMEYYLSDLDKVYDKQHTLNTMRQMTNKCTSEWLGPLLTRAAIDDVETAAVYGLLCCPSYLSKASPRVMEVCYKYHLRIFQELHQHYRRTGRTEYSSRVAHLTSILLCVQAAIQRLKEDMQIYRLLDVYGGDELVFNIVK
ncbi:hypothetical protein PENTCL1PPCAC_14814, partial [Pristionchus entomophagus]